MNRLSKWVVRPLVVAGLARPLLVRADLKRHHSDHPCVLGFVDHSLPTRVCHENQGNLDHKTAFCAAVDTMSIFGGEEGM